MATELYKVKFDIVEFQFFTFHVNLLHKEINNV